MSCQLKNKKFTLKSNTLNKNREKEGISKKLNEVASMLDNKLMEVKKRDLEEIKHTTVRRIEIRYRSMDVISVGKVEI